MEVFVPPSASCELVRGGVAEGLGVRGLEMVSRGAQCALYLPLFKPSIPPLTWNVSLNTDHATRPHGRAGPSSCPLERGTHAVSSRAARTPASPRSWASLRDFM